MTIQDILSERAATHGSFQTQATCSLALKKSFYAHCTKPLSDCQHEAVHMIFHKLARIAAGDHNHPDHWQDIAGYAQLVVNHLQEPPT